MRLAKVSSRCKSRRPHCPTTAWGNSCDLCVKTWIAEAEARETSVPSEGCPSLTRRARGPQPPGQRAPDVARCQSATGKHVSGRNDRWQQHRAHRANGAPGWTVLGGGGAGAGLRGLPLFHTGKREVLLTNEVAAGVWVRAWPDGRGFTEETKGPRGPWGPRGPRVGLAEGAEQDGQQAPQTPSRSLPAQQSGSPVNPVSPSLPSGRVRRS